MTTVENVTNTLRREILNGEFAGGLRLVEQELTARYGVARHTLRAALRELASEGLVKIEPNRGARVARLSAEERKLFDDLPRGIATPTSDQLGRPLPEPHASWIPALEQAWLKRYSG